MQKNADRIAIYSRKSKFTGKGESIGNQVELCKEYVRSMFGEDWGESCVVFEDEGFSGGNLKRPDFQRMMESVRRHEFRAIVVYRLDRISRNISDFTGLIDELTKMDVAFVSIREQFDTSTPMGRAMMFIISVFSQLERETIAERIRDNMHELAKTGRWLGGNAPLGFRSASMIKISIDGKERKSYQLVPVQEEIGIPKMIFDLYTEMDSLTAVETELLHRRIRTKRGKYFTRFAIKAILQNPVYMIADEEAYRYFLEKDAEMSCPQGAFDGTCGVMAYNRTSQEKGKATVLLPVSRWIIAPGRHTGVIPSGQWIRVQESLERNKTKGFRKPRRNEALLTGLVYCRCGGRMYPKQTQRKNASGVEQYSYVCKMKERSKGALCQCRNAAGNALDAAIMERIGSLPADEYFLVAQLAKNRRLFTHQQEDSGKRREELRTEYARNEETIRGLIDSLGLAGDSNVRQRLMARIEELSEANREVENCIRQLEKQAAVNTLCSTEMDLLRQSLSVFCISMEESPVAEKRDAVRMVVDRVIWDGQNAHVVLAGADWRETGFSDMEDNNLTEGCVLSQTENPAGNFPAG